MSQESRDSTFIPWQTAICFLYLPLTDAKLLPGTVLGHVTFASRFVARLPLAYHSFFFSYSAFVCPTHEASSLHTKCGVYLKLHLVVSDTPIFDSPFRILGCYTWSSSFDRRVVCTYDCSGWANVMISRTSSYKYVQYVQVWEHVTCY